jgi:deoxyhypusine synthase
VKRLYDRREALLETLQKDYLAAKDKPVVKEEGAEEVPTYPCGTPIKR